MKIKKFFSWLLTTAMLAVILISSFTVSASETPSITISAYQRYLVVGQTTSMSATTTPSGLSVSWTSSNSAVATIDNYYRTVTAIGKGTTRITATCTDPVTGITVSASTYIYVFDQTGLVLGTEYYIMNSYTKMLMSLERASDANNVNVIGDSRSTSVLARWRAEKGTGGAYNLVSTYSSSGRKLYASGTNMVIYNSSGGYSRMYIRRVESGAYRGLYLIMCANKYVTLNANGNVYLADTSSYRSYWSFMPVEKGNADLFGTNITGTPKNDLDTTEIFSYFKTKFNNMGYTAATQENSTAQVVYDTLLTDDVCIMFSHGDAGVISFYTQSGADNGSIVVNQDVGKDINLYAKNDKYIDSIDTNALANTRCVFYLACNTGNDYVYTSTTATSHYNLVDATFDKGAHFVLGLEASVSESSAATWLMYFVNNLMTGLNINDACLHADTLTQNIYIQDSEGKTVSTDTMPIYTAGDAYQFIY